MEPNATLQRTGRPASFLALTCDTLWIDTDRGICTLVWRGTVPLTHAQEPGLFTTAPVGASGQ